MSRPGAWTRLWSNLFESVQIGTKKKFLVGKDNFGNVYYEERAARKPTIVKKFTNRGFIPGGDFRNVPVEWDSWLRGTRIDPPTKDELALNNARQEAQALADSETEKRAPKVAVEGEIPVQKNSAFPKYDDLETGPGAKSDDKGKND